MINSYKQFYMAVQQIASVVVMSDNNNRVEYSSKSSTIIQVATFAAVVVIQHSIMENWKSYLNKYNIKNLLLKIKMKMTCNIFYVV